MPSFFQSTAFRRRKLRAGLWGALIFLPVALAFALLPAQWALWLLVCWVVLLILGGAMWIRAKDHVARSRSGLDGDMVESVKQQRWPYGLGFLPFLGMVALEPIIGIAYLYLLYKVLTLPTWMQVLMGLLIWVLAGLGIYRLHQTMKKGLEKV